MRKVLIAPVIELRTYTSREWWMTFNLLAKQYQWDLLDRGCLPDVAGLLPDVLRARFGSVPEVVLFREDYEQFLRHRRSLLDAGARMYVLTEDMHHRNADMANALRVAHGILAPYAPRLAAFYPNHDPARLFWVPHAAGPDFLRDPNDAPEPVVFVSGREDQVYPFRLLMYAMARRRPDRFRIHKHPGYGDFELDSDARVGPGYAAQIARCLAAFTDASCFLYIVAKHFEIPATGALLIAARDAAPQLQELGFIDGVHYISAAPDDIEPIIERVLDPRHRAEIDGIRRCGHMLVHERHTVAHRAAQIDRICV
jgi:Glycosyl transferases group 1